MILALDGYEASVSHPVGIGRYAREILLHLHREIAGKVTRGERWDVRVYVPEKPHGLLPTQTSWWQYHILRPRRLWTFIALPIALRTDLPRTDVIFSPTHYIPRFVSVPRVMSVMDLSYVYYPKLFRPKDLHQLVHWTKYSVSHARAILTISSFSKHAIMDSYRVSDERVRVIYPGFSTLGSPSMTPDQITKKYSVSRHFILSVGTLQPRKNYTRLIYAFAAFLKKNKQRFGNVELIIIGKKGWLYDEILKAPKEAGIAEKVRFLDFIADEELSAFYANALCFVLPSLYEGFGLPVLEAMAYKCPVVVSRSSSLPEIAGKAGIYVDPEKVDSIAHGLLTAVRERNLLQGRTRIQEGLSQVKKFTWEKAAKETLDVIERVGKGQL